MKNKKMKPFIILLAGTLIVSLSGCGNTIPSLSEEQEALVVEYASTAVLKHDANYQGKLVDLSTLKNEEETPVEETMQAPAEEADIPKEPEQMQEPQQDVFSAEQAEAEIQADVVEDGTTFEENALIKASEIAKIAHEMPEYKEAVVMADDSGLEIDYLNKEPGIYSARYAGTDTSYDIKNSLLLSRMKGVPDKQRTARFVCAVAAVFPNGDKEVVRGTMEGCIGYEIAGANGFGYDPIFFLPEYGCTSAELAPEKKNELSHRGEALRMMRQIMEKKL